MDARVGSARFWGERGLARVVVACAAWLVPMLVLAALGVMDEHNLVTGGMHIALVCIAVVPPLLLYRVRCDPPGAPYRLPTMIRTAVAAASVHMVVVATVAALWFTHNQSHRLYVEIYLSIPNALPLADLGAIIGGLVIGATLVDLYHARRSPPRWTRRLTSYALVHMLFLGLWSPIIAVAASADLGPVELALTALLPPTVTAALALGVLERKNVELDWGVVTRVILLAAGIGAFLMLPNNVVNLAHYINLMVFLFVDAALVLTALSMNALCQWWSLRMAKNGALRSDVWAQEGVAQGDNGVLAWCEDRGPLAGVHYRVRAFRLRTRAGALEVPAGSRLLTPMPEDATCAEGDRIAIIPNGARVIVTGYVHASGEGPFRSSALPVPGPDGLVVTLAERAPVHPSRELLLASWRPAALYLLISLAAWLPALAAAIRG